MKHVLIEWIGEERHIPGCGMGRRGLTLSVTPEQKRSFIAQGLALPYEPNKRSGKTKDEEVPKS